MLLYRNLHTCHIIKNKSSVNLLARICLSHLFLPTCFTACFNSHYRLSHFSNGAGKIPWTWEPSKNNGNLNTPHSEMASHLFEKIAMCRVFPLRPLNGFEHQFSGSSPCSLLKIAILWGTQKNPLFNGGSKKAKNALRDRHSASWH